jgi:invasion protein IalB
VRLCFGLASVWLAIWGGPIYALRNPERKAGLVAPPRLKESCDTSTVSCGLRTVDGNPVKACATSQEQIEQRSRQRVLATEL